MKDCIFCKIAEKNIPNHTVYEDDHTLAFLDIHPHAKGHTVVIPKLHTERLSDMNEELNKEFFAGLRHAVGRVNRVLNPDGINLGLNDGETAGQVVPHLHMHIFPRYVGDGGSSVHHIVNAAGDESVEEVAKRFAEHT